MNIAPIKLLAGSHSDTGETGVGCFMNVIAYLNGEPQITDQSECVCFTVRPMAIFLNDLANNEQRQRMVPLILRAMGSTTSDKVEISRRLALLVEFAQWQAGLAAESAESAKSAKSAAEYAKYAAKYSAESAESAAKYAVKYAESAAKYAAKYSAESAKHSTESAKYSAKYAESAAEYRTVTFDRGMALLDAMLPPLTEPDAIYVARANRLHELATA